MMNKTYLLLPLLFMLVANIALAQNGQVAAVNPTATPNAPKQNFVNNQRITQIILGNSVTGKIGVNSFSQFFAPNGYTLYEPKSGKKEVGLWRVKQDGQVCTLWYNNKVMACYFAEESSDGLKWYGPVVDGQNPTVMSVTAVEKGNKTSVPANKIAAKQNTSMAMTAMGHAMAKWLAMK
jgi:hypothetical protein